MAGQAADTDSNPHLKAIIREEARDRGAITFARFMELALYHPEHGYYSGPMPRIGPDGDYYTSTDVSPLFGATIGRQLREMWLSLGSPERFTVLEWGAGKGLLVADVLGWAGAAHPEFFGSLDYLILELSPGLRRHQEQALRRLPVRWGDPSDLGASGIVGCSLSNEVADALPFHRVQLLNGGLRELWVVERDGELFEEPGGPSTPLLSEYLSSHGVTLRDEQTAEINLEAPRWLRSQVDLLERGYVLALDYGEDAKRLYSQPGGTLACYYHHTRNEEPFRRIGRQDITARVNFTALAHAGRAAGAEVTGYTTQAYFLAGLGLGEALAARFGDEPTGRDYARDRAAVAQLVDPEGLGGFRVLGLHRGVRRPRLSGFSLGSEPLWR